MLTGVSSKAVCSTAASYELNKTSNNSETNHKRKTKDRLLSTTTTATISNNSTRRELISAKSPINEGRSTEAVSKSKKHSTLSQSTGCFQQYQTYNSNPFYRNLLTNFDNPTNSSDNCVNTIKHCCGDSGLNCSVKPYSSDSTYQTYNELTNLSSNLSRLYPHQDFNMSANENNVGQNNINSSLLPGRTTNLRIEDADTVNNSRKCDIDSQELQKASKVSTFE